MFKFLQKHLVIIILIFILLKFVFSVFRLNFDNESYNFFELSANLIIQSLFLILFFHFLYFRKLIDNSNSFNVVMFLLIALNVTLNVVNLFEKNLYLSEIVKSSLGLEILDIMNNNIYGLIVELKKDIDKFDYLKFTQLMIGLIYTYFIASTITTIKHAETISGSIKLRAFIFLLLPFANIFYLNYNFKILLEKVKEDN